ncbi:MAG: DUF4373 domain-containing protein, partial [Clostridia bacterium]|nr:DUF4373 domain-containing protein [Clostridia bacterium]
MVKDTYWFQHDYNARNDVKIQALMTDHGAAGYGVFFILLEVLREQSDYRLKLDRYTYDTLAAQSRSDKKTVRKILKDCMEKYIDAEGPLICTDGEYIRSDGLIRRLEGLKENRERRSEAARKAVNSRWNKERGDTNVLQNDTNVLRNDTITEQYSTEEYSTEQNITEEYSTEEYTTKQDTKKENEEKGGGSIGEAIVSDFFAEEALEPDNYFGASEETKSEADKLTNEIWKRF